MARHSEQRAPGAPLANTNGGSPWPLSDQDPRAGRARRRRVNCRPAGVPSELRPVMRPVTYTMVEVEDRLEVMRDYLDNDFSKSMVNNPRDRFSELVPVYQETGIIFEQRYYVVGENKLIDIVSGDSDASEALVFAAVAS